MKTLTVMAAAVLGACMSWAQVRIVSADRSGALGWTNLAWISRDFSYPDAVYRIERADSPTGPWSVLTNTTETSWTGLAPSRGAERTFYRVAWTNGEMWRYQAFDTHGLVVTGTLYVAVSHLIMGPRICGGSWELASAALGDAPDHPTGQGLVAPAPFPSAGPLTVYLSPCGWESCFYLILSTQTENTWDGTWHWRLFETSAEGTFTATRMPEDR